MRIDNASSRFLFLSAVTLALALGGCVEERDGRDSMAGIGGPKADDADDHDDHDDGAQSGQPTGLDSKFAAAADTHDVPVEVLQALAWVETRWQMVEGHEELGSRAAAFGIMGLRGVALEEAAELAGVSVQEAKTETMANIDAGAALLSSMAEQFEIDDRTDIGAWAEVISEYSGIDDDLGRAMFVHHEVYPTMREGVVSYTEDGDVQGELVPIDAWPSVAVPPPVPALSAGPDYSGSVWRPSPNHSSRGSGSSAKPQFIVIHTCEGSYAGCWSWLKNSASGVSAHYVVNSTGSEITQLVEEDRKAWHISANYDCNKNDGVSCGLNGIGSNKFTIGIEHAGFGSQASWDEGLIDASAKLVCDIAKDNGIPLDEEHVWGHGMMQPWNRSDPGKNWPWATYMAKAKAYCGGGGDPEPDPEPDPDDGGVDPDPGGGGDVIIVDSNNSNNDSDVGFISVSSKWTSSASTPGYHGTGYWYASAQAISDPATFWFYLPKAESRTIEAWWTTGGDRNGAAPFLVVDASGSTIATVKKDQRSGGNSWNTIGTYNLPAGWNRVMLSRWASGGGVVIADAIRVK